MDMPRIIVIPPFHRSHPDGLVDVTLDFSPERIMAYYHHGIFCWFQEDEAIFWFSPEERLVIFPDRIVESDSMRRLARQGKYTITLNQAFDEVVQACAEQRGPGRHSTWLNENFRQNYRFLYEQGLCLSVEVWNPKGELAGGLFATKIGRVLSGESMFSRESNTSKLALIWLCKNMPLDCIDCQAYSPHLERMGGTLIPRSAYLNILSKQDKRFLTQWGVVCLLSQPGPSPHSLK